MATSELEDYGAAVVELVASFEAVLAGDSDALEEDEYFVESLVDRRYSILAIGIVG